MANHNPQTNPNSLRNLESHKWKKGQCPNTKGRSGAYNVATEFKRFLLSRATANNGERVERLKALMTRLFASAMNGDNRSAEILLDRGFGKPKQEILTDEPSENKSAI